MNPPPSNRRAFIRQAACAALGTAATRNCLRDLHFINAAVAQGPFSEYKALVCIFLGGGNDSGNLIVPTIPEEHTQYATTRTAVLAIPNTDGGPATLQALDPLNHDGHDYGLHPACAELAAMFNNDNSASGTFLGKVAAVLNAGPLVYPMTKSQYVANTVPRPQQLGSHSDQITQWQTSIPDAPPTTGWGGRIADLLHAENPQTLGTDTLATCITLTGANTFQVGASVQQYAVTSSGVIALANPNSPTSAAAGRQTMLNNLLSLQKTAGNLYLASYADALENTIATSGVLSAALAGTQMASYWSTVANWSKTATLHQIVAPNGGTPFTSSLMAQLRMVAQIIEAGHRSAGSSNGLGMKRQIFYCSAAGYDTHSNQTNAAGATPTPDNVILGSHANLLAEVSQCVHAFQRAMKAIGAQYGDADFLNRVTSFTASDFGRTFKCNGLGSDHGWGGHHLVVGGAVQGRKTYGTYPALVIGGPDDIGTGRWLPTTSVDQYAATMAKWFGVSNANLSTIFPNLSRFGPTDLGFMA